MVRTFGETTGKPFNHVTLLNALQGIDCERGVKVAGGRGYFLRGDIVLLNYALINYGLQFLAKKGYTGLQPPFFMRKAAMAQCAQLEQFDEELYHVSGRCLGGGAPGVGLRALGGLWMALDGCGKAVEGFGGVEGSRVEGTGGSSP